MMQVNETAIPNTPFPIIEYDRNVTGSGGPVRLHLQERGGQARMDENGTISEITGKLVIGDKDSLGGNWWEFMLHGVHHLKYGGIVLTTTSER
jgi:transmembrane E3 ubiquitin-protein ligase